MTDVDRIEEDVIVTFDDGVTKRFPVELPSEMAVRVQVLPATAPDNAAE